MTAVEAVEAVAAVEAVEPVVAAILTESAVAAVASPKRVPIASVPMLRARCVCTFGADAPHGGRCNRSCKPDSVYCRSCWCRDPTLRCACSCSACDPKDLSSGSGEEQSQADEEAQPGDADNHDTKYDDRKGKCNAANVSGGADLSFLTSLNYAIPAPKRPKLVRPPPYSGMLVRPLAPPAGKQGKAAGKNRDTDEAARQVPPIAKAIYARRSKLVASLYDGTDDNRQQAAQRHLIAFDETVGNRPAQESATGNTQRLR